MSCSSFDADESLVTEESEQEDDDYYYASGIGMDDDLIFDEQQRQQDPEAFEYSVITRQDAENMLETLVQETAKKIEQPKSIARILLTKHSWNVDKVIKRFKNNQQSLLVELRITPKGVSSKCRVTECQVCFQYISEPVAFPMTCGHTFCMTCWNAHVAIQLENKVALGIECMKCGVLVGPDDLLEIISRPDLLKKFRFLLLYDQIKTHPLLRCCPETDCGSIIRAEACKAKRAVCFRCKTSFCFQCGQDYHAPTDCAVIKRWLTKCQDDSETANYIQANTKDCPKCMICIEKNGGCNHMQCYKCKYGFCWVCLGDWQKHTGGYYECSIYKQNPALVEQNSGTEARDALKKYLFYYERWHNHGTSLKLEHEMRKKINQKIHEKVNNNVGTWIDWQYLSDAAFLLAKMKGFEERGNHSRRILSKLTCRYTIMYTYPYAYYMGDERKELFEYQQAQLEQEIENLSWKLEREEQYTRGDFENQMDIAEKRRRTLLKDFLAS